MSDTKRMRFPIDIAGRGWRMDETYIKVKTVWTYLYRAADKDGNTVGFLSTKKRDKAATKEFFIKPC